MNASSLWKHAAIVGSFFILLYAACLLWRFTMTDAAVMQFHLLGLKSAFPGFNGYDAGSIIWGGILSFVYGFILSVIFHSLHENCTCTIKK